MSAPVRLHVLDLGRLRLDASVLVADQPGGTIAEVPVSAYVVEHPDGRVLFDTGCHPRAMGPQGLWPPAFQAAYPWHGDEACHLPNRLAALGLGPDDFSAVVLSHLHTDHAGCVEFFSRAKLIAHADEFAAALAAHRARDDSAYVTAETERWRRLDLNWHTLARDAGDVPINDATTVLNLGPGHAAGMLGLHVRLPETGDLLLVSDALYCAANLSPAFRRPGSLVDPPAWDRTARSIAALAEQHRAKIWFGHDAAQFATLRHSTEGWYE
jgi:glyoxylase-like metal-dependent hydrolase (beta-lactamase superfamily II)